MASTTSLPHLGTDNADAEVTEIRCKNAGSIVCRCVVEIGAMSKLSCVKPLEMPVDLSGQLGHRWALPAEKHWPAWGRGTCQRCSAVNWNGPHWRHDQRKGPDTLSWWRINFVLAFSFFRRNEMLGCRPCFLERSRLTLKNRDPTVCVCDAVFPRSTVGSLTAQF